MGAFFTFGMACGITTPTPVDRLSGVYMPLGDSLTLGDLQVFPPPSTVVGYRCRFVADAVADGYTIVMVGSQSYGTCVQILSEGHPGYVISQITAGAAAWLAAQPSTAKIILMIGTNDVLQQIDLANAGVRLATCLDAIHTAASAAHVFVVTIPPLADAGFNTDAGTYNARIPAIVAARSTWASSIDGNSALTTADLGADGIHLLQTGYNKLGDFIYSKVKLFYL